ncbi:type II secretion system F family protein, partial [Candidatus Woesearchaeota archaeon]|nr:type II secretion system F family protein [Candidatus Woesearchaeota archaeon]
DKKEGEQPEKPVVQDKVEEPKTEDKKEVHKKGLPGFKENTFSKIKKDYQAKNPFTKKKKKKVKVSKYRRLKNLKNYLEKAGYTIKDESKISKIIIRIAVFLTFLLTIYVFYTAYWRRDKLVSILPTLFAIWSVVLLIIIALLWVLFYFLVDLRIFRRRLALEEVLPDFLQLTAANINAGMPIDRALWFAVRPRFGILAKEIEEVAKSTLVGEDLQDALIKFTKKFDSVTLKRSVNLLIEGLEAGGKIADIINKIAKDIQDIRIFKKEMAANVTTYVIFISFASIGAAPILFALSKQLLLIIISIMGNITMPQSSSLAFSFDASGINPVDFNIFAIATLTMTAVFSAIIVSIIKKGNVKEGLNYIPSFIITSLLIYTFASFVLGIFIGGMF